MNTQNFVNHVNALRLHNKDKWFFDIGTVNGKPYKVKGFNTYLQILEISGIRFGGLADISVKNFKKELESAANYNQ